MDGIGTQGTNLIVFSGVPTILLGDLFQIFQKPQPWAPLVAYLLLFAVVIFALVLAGQASRDIPVQYGRRPRSNVFSTKTAIPLRMPADFEPAEYAQTFLLIPGFIAGLLAGSSIAWLSSPASSWAFWLSCPG